MKICKIIFRLKKVEKSTLFIVILIVLSLVYIFVIVNLFRRVIDPACVECAGSVKIIPLLSSRYEIPCRLMSLNEVGDYFAGLLAILSTAWLVIAFIWQARELAFQRKEFETSNNLAVQRNDSEKRWQNTQYVNDMIPAMKKKCQLVNELHLKIVGQKIENSPQTMASTLSFIDKVIKKGFLSDEGNDVPRYNSIVDELISEKSVLEHILPNSYIKVVPRI